MRAAVSFLSVSRWFTSRARYSLESTSSAYGTTKTGTFSGLYRGVGRIFRRRSDMDGSETQRRRKTSTSRMENRLGRGDPLRSLFYHRLPTTSSAAELGLSHAPLERARTTRRWRRRRRGNVPIVFVMEERRRRRSPPSPPHQSVV